MAAKKQTLSWLDKAKSFVLQRYGDIKRHIEEQHTQEAFLKQKKQQIMADEIKTISEEQQHEEELTQFVTVSYAASFRFWIVGIALAYLGYLAFQSLSIIYLVFAALIISMAMEAGIYKLSQWITRGPAIILSYILLVLFVFSGIIILVPFVIEQLSLIVNIVASKVANIITLIETGGIEALLATIYLPDSIRVQLVDYLEYEGLAGQLAIAIKQNLANIVTVSKSVGERAGTLFVDIISGFFNSLFKMLIVVTLAMFFSIEKDQLVKFLAGVGGGSHRVYRELKLQTLYKKLGQWLQSQLIVSLFIGTFVYIMLWIISPWVAIDGKLSLALIVSLTAIIPYLGPILGALPALIAASVTSGFIGFVVVFLVYGFVQQIEGNFFTPFFMKRQLGVSPVLIFLVVLLGGITLGFVGIILAVPLAVIITLLLDDDFA